MRLRILEFVLIVVYGMREDSILNQWSTLHGLHLLSQRERTPINDCDSLLYPKTWNFRIYPEMEIVSGPQGLLRTIDLWWNSSSVIWDAGNYGARHGFLHWTEDPLDDASPDTIFALSWRTGRICFLTILFSSIYERWMEGRRWQRRGTGRWLSHTKTL